MSYLFEHRFGKIQENQYIQRTKALSDKIIGYYLVWGTLGISDNMLVSKKNKFGVIMFNDFPEDGEFLC